MSNKFSKKPAPLPNFKPVTGGTPVPQTHSPNSALRTQHSALEPHSALSTQDSSLPREAPHPLASHSFPRIDILHGGSQASAVRDMLRLVRDALSEMVAEESALVINTSASHAAMEDVAQKISKRQAAKMMVLHASGDALMQRLDFLEHIIETKRVRLLVVSSFEFAACYSRQRNRLAHWLRRMRDVHDVRIVVYSLEQSRPQPGGHAGGALALLAWTSDFVRPLHKINDPRELSEPTNANETIRELVEELEIQLPSFRAEREIPSGSAESPSQPASDPTQDSALSTQDFIPDPTQDSALSTQHFPKGLDREFALYQTTRQLTRLGNAPLKNKDLQPHGELA